MYCCNCTAFRQFWHQNFSAVTEHCNTVLMSSSLEA